MKLYINGTQDAVVYIKDSTQTIQVLSVGDSGIGEDISSLNPVLEIYQTLSRTSAAIASKALTGGIAAAGAQEAVLVATEADFIDLSIGTTYYAFLKTDDGGGLIGISENAIPFRVA